MSVVSILTGVDLELVIFYFSLSRWQTGGWLFFPGGRPGAGYFSCSARKSNQKEAAPWFTALAGGPVLLDKAGACGTRSKNEKTR